MAMTAIETATLATKFSARAEMEIQQSDSRTAPSTQMETGGIGTNGYQIVNRVQAITPRTVTDLISVRDTAIDAMNSDSRFMPAPVSYEINRAYTTESLLLRLIDEKSAERESIVAGFKRQEDIVFVNAAVADAQISTSIVAANTTDNTPAAFKIPTGYAALPAGNTITAVAADTATSVVRKVIDVVSATALDWSNEQKIMYIPSKFVSMLFRDQSYINAPYLETETLIKGSLSKTILGVSFIPLDDTGVWKASTIANATTALFCVGKPVAVSVWRDFVSEIAQAPTKNFAWILHCSMSMSATRLWEEKVYKVDLAAVTLS